MGLFVCFWSIIDLQRYESSWCRTQWFSISMHYKMLTTISLVTIRHHTKILQNYWLYSPCCTFHICDIYLVAGSLYLLISLTYYSPLQNSLPSGNHLFCSLYLWLCFWCLFICLVFLDSPYKWNHTVFVFLWLISLNIIPSRSIDVVANGKDFILFCGWVIFHCVHTPHLLYPFLYRWTLRLLLYLGYYKLCCNEHRGADIFLS